MYAVKIGPGQVSFFVYLWDAERCVKRWAQQGKTVTIVKVQ